MNRVYNNEWWIKNTLSIFSCKAHILAMEPMLLVIVTKVALAKSSLLTFDRLSLEFICPKLKMQEL